MRKIIEGRERKATSYFSGTGIENFVFAGIYFKRATIIKEHQKRQHSGNISDSAVE